MTDSARQALLILRDPGQFQWYVIPLLALVTYVYATEAQNRNWNVIFAGLTYFGLDICIEIVNSLIFHFTGYAPAWGTPGATAYLLLIGMNIEIFFMFAIVGLVMAKFLPGDRKAKILGMPGRAAVIVCAGALCAGVECLLNATGALTWEYPWWNTGPAALIIFGGYSLFFTVSFWVHDMKTMRAQVTTVGALLGFDVALLVILGGLLKWI
jgi:hypothetical protein